MLFKLLVKVVAHSAITCPKSVAHQNFSFRDPLAFSNYCDKEELVVYHHLHIRVCSINEMLIFLRSLLKAERLNQVGIFIKKTESDRDMHMDKTKFSQYTLNTLLNNAIVGINASNLPKDSSYLLPKHSCLNFSDIFGFCLFNIQRSEHESSRGTKEKSWRKRRKE